MLQKQVQTPIERVWGQLQQSHAHKIARQNNHSMLPKTTNSDSKYALKQSSETNRERKTQR